MRRGTDSTQFIIYQSSIGLLLNCVWNKGQFMSHASKWVMYQRSQDSLLVKCRTHDKKVASSNPSRSGGRIFFSRVIFVLWLLFGVCSTPVLPQWQVKDPGHSAKCAGGRLHLNTHTPLTQQSPSRLTIPLFRHSEGTCQKTGSHAIPQGTLGHSRLRLLRHCGPILGKERNYCARTDFH